MYHPLRLAEEVALLDVLSGGRVNWGAGRGNDPTEFGVFSLDRDTSYGRFRENVEIVLRAWKDERLNYQGEFFEFHDVEFCPSRCSSRTRRFGSPRARPPLSPGRRMRLFDPDGPTLDVQRDRDQTVRLSKRARIVGS